MVFASIPRMAFSKIKFCNPDLSDSDELIYAVENNFAGENSYKTLFATKLGEEKILREPQILTCFPERMELLDDGKILQIRNRYGIANYYTAQNIFQWQSRSLKIPVKYTNLPFNLPSPDGKFVCFVKRVKNAEGKLILKNNADNEEIILSEKSPFSCDTINAKWSPDGKVLLYEKNGSVYFVFPEASFKRVDISETFRRIGEGSIDSVNWTLQNSVIYLKDDIIYKIDGNELYTRGLYSTLIGIGKIVGRLSTSFDFRRDKFWINSSGKKMAVLVRENILSTYSVGDVENFSYVRTESISSLTEFYGANYRYEIFFSRDRDPLLWVDTISFENVEKSSFLYDVNGGMKMLLNVKNSLLPILSPDRRKILVTDQNKIFVYDLYSKNISFTKSGEKIYSALWNGNFSFYAGGEESIKLVSLAGEEKFIFLSAAENAFWDGEKIRCASKNPRTSFVYDAQTKSWKKSSASLKGISQSEKNARYRVFLGASLNEKFENSVYARSLRESAKTYAVYEDADLSENAPKKVALIFDAMENAEGLSKILYTLTEFKIRGTFFLNGEFIRRYPQKVRQIFSSGNKCASLFFSSMDLVENKFIVDKDFVVRGLARNEDEFFSATGSELSLYWHAPFYHANRTIRDAASGAGYTYVDVFDKVSDRVSFEDQDSGKKYLDASSLIDSFVDELYDGMIIPVSVGKGSGTRNDYLYEKLDLLIASILDNDFEIVPLKEILDE